MIVVSPPKPAAVPPGVWGLIAGVVVLWGLVASVEVLTLRALSPLPFSAWTTIAGAIGTFVFLAARGRTHELLRYSPRDHGKLAVISLLGFGLYFFLKYTAYSTSPVAEASVLQSTYMVFIALFAIPILGQKASAGKITAILVGFAGAALIISGGSFSGFHAVHLPGYLCALGAGVSFGLFSNLSEKAGYDHMTALFYYHAYSALFLVAVLGFRGEFAFPSTGWEIAGILYNGPAANVLGIFLWLRAQRSVKDVSLLTAALYLVPFLALVSFAVFLHISIPLHALQGLLLIVGGMAIHTIRVRRRTAAVRVNRHSFSPPTSEP